MKLLGYPIVPLVLTYILTPLMESEFRRGLMLVHNNPLEFFTRPVFVILLIVGVIAFISASNVFARIGGKEAGASTRTCRPDESGLAPLAPRSARRPGRAW